MDVRSILSRLSLRGVVHSEAIQVGRPWCRAEEEMPRHWLTLRRRLGRLMCCAPVISAAAPEGSSVAACEPGGKRGV
jgi:hypothetical protein